MNQEVFLYTLPQWFVFAGIIASVYGWVEKKQVFRLMGPVVFFLLGVFAVYALSKGYFSSHRFLTPEEIVNEEMEIEMMEGLPFVAQIMPAYLVFIFSGLLSVPSFFMELKNRKGKNLFIILMTISGLLGFFIIVGALRSL